MTILQVAKREKEDEIYTLERKYESKSICYVIISVATRNLGYKTCFDQAGPETNEFSLLRPSFRNSGE